MLKSARSWLLILLASWLSCAQALPNDMRADDYFGRAKQLLRRLYPGLDRNLRAVLIDENRLNESGSPDVGRMNHLTIELHDLEIKPGTDSSNDVVAMAWEPRKRVNGIRILTLFWQLGGADAPYLHPETVPSGRASHPT